MPSRATQAASATRSGGLVVGLPGDRGSQVIDVAGADVVGVELLQGVDRRASLRPFSLANERGGQPTLGRIVCRVILEEGGQGGETSLGREWNLLPGCTGGDGVGLGVGELGERLIKFIERLAGPILEGLVDRLAQTEVIKDTSKGGEAEPLDEKVDRHRRLMVGEL